MDWNVIEQLLVQNAKDRDATSCSRRSDPLNSCEFWTREFLKRHRFELIHWASDIMRSPRHDVRGIDTMACYRPVATRVVLRDWACVTDRRTLDRKLDEFFREYMDEVLYDLSMHIKWARQCGRILHWFPYILLIPSITLCPDMWEPIIQFSTARAWHSIDPEQFPDYDHEKTNPFPEDHNLANR